MTPTISDARAAITAAEQALADARHNLAHALAADGCQLMSSRLMEDGSTRDAVYLRTNPDGSTDTQRLEAILAEATA